MSTSKSSSFEERPSLQIGHEDYAASFIQIFTQSDKRGPNWPVSILEPTFVLGIAIDALQDNDSGGSARGEQRFRSYDQTDQGNRHSAMNFNAAGDSRARNQVVGDRDGYQTSMRRYGDKGGEQLELIHM